MDDFFSEVLDSLQLETALYFKESFSAPWGVQIEAGAFSQFHIVTRGQCQIAVKAQEQVIDLGPGDMVLFPKSVTHRIGSGDHQQDLPGVEVLRYIRAKKNPFAGSSIDTTVICGHYSFDRDIIHPFVDQLPGLILLRRENYTFRDTLDVILQMIIREMDQKNPGSERVVLRLAEVLLIKIINHHYTHSASPNFVSDPVVRKALQFMHHDFSKEWKINGLAKAIGTSRTLLFSRFKSAIGLSPMQYLSNWRMIQAKRLLKKSNLSISEITDLVGYQSESSFGRAFRSHHKISPSQYRRQCQASYEIQNLNPGDRQDNQVWIIRRY